MRHGSGEADDQTTEWSILRYRSRAGEPRGMIADMTQTISVLGAHLNLLAYAGMQVRPLRPERAPCSLVNLAGAYYTFTEEPAPLSGWHHGRRNAVFNE